MYIWLHRFWASPIAILVANFAMQKWIREKVANGVNLCVDFCGLVVFLVSAATYWIRLKAYATKLTPST